MPNTPAATLNIELTGGMSSLNKTLKDAESRLDQYAARVERVGQRVEKSLVQPIATINKLLSALDTKLQSVNPRLDSLANKSTAAATGLETLGKMARGATVGMDDAAAATDGMRTAAATAVPVVKDLAVAVKDAKGAATGTASAVTSAASSISGMGTKLGATFTGIATGAAKTEKAVNGFTAAMNKAVAAGNRKINAKFGTSGSGAGGGGGAYALERGGSALTGLGLAAAVPLVAASAAVYDFDKAMSDAANNTVMTTKQVAEFRDNVKQIASVSSQPIENIANAFMKAANYGHTGADAMQIVSIANMAAVKSGADVTKTTEALVQIMHQFKIPTGDAARVMNLLDTVSDSTNQTLEAFVTSSGRGLQSAAEMHVGLLDAASAMGVLTESGMSAAQSATSFRAIIKGIESPTKAAQKAIEDLSQRSGVDLVSAFSVAGLAHYGLAGVMEMVRKATKGNGDELKKVFTDQRNFIPLLTLITNEHKNLGQVVQAGTQAFLENNRVQNLYQERTKNLDYQLGQLKNKIIVVGSSFKDALTPSLLLVNKQLNIFLSWLNNLDPDTKQLLINTLAIVAALGLFVGGLITLIAKIGMAVEAITALKLAMAEAGTTGAAAFAAGGSWFIVITAAVWLVSNLVTKWQQVTSAQDDAAASAQRYANAQKDLATNGGERGALEVNIQQIADTRAKIKASIDDASQPATGLFNPPGSIKGFRNASGGWMSDEASKARIKTLQAQYDKLGVDYDAEKSKLHEINSNGAGAVNKNITASGVDGFAKAVVGHAFDEINTPKNLASCAFYVSEVFKRAGANIPDGGIGRAKDLIKWAQTKDKLGHGVDMAIPGDLLAVHGKGYGKNGSGYHVGIALGNGMMIDSSGDGPGHIKKAHPISDEKGAVITAYTVSGGPLPSYLRGGNGPVPTNTPTTNTKGSNSVITPAAESPYSALEQKLQRYQDFLDGSGGVNEAEAAVNHNLAKTYEENRKKFTDEGARKHADENAKLYALTETYKLISASIANATNELVNHSAEIDRLQKKFEQAKQAQYDFIHQRGAPKNDRDRAAYHKLQQNTYDTSHQLTPLTNLMSKQMDIMDAGTKKQVELQQAIDATTDALKRQHDQAVKAAEKALLSADKLEKTQYNNGKGSVSRSDYTKYLQTQLASPDIDPQRAASLDAELIKLQSISGVVKEMDALLKSSIPHSDYQDRISAIGTRADTATSEVEAKKGGMSADEYKTSIDAIAQYKINSTNQVLSEEARANRAAQLEMQKFTLDIGKQTVKEYQDFLSQSIAAMASEYENGSYADAGLAQDIKTKHLEFLSSKWQSMNDEVTSLKESMDEGDISAKQYIGDLEAMKAALNAPDTPAGRDLQKQIDAMYKAQNKANDRGNQKTADEIGGKTADIFMDVRRHTDTLKGAIRKAATEALDEAMKQSVKNLVSDAAKKMLDKLHPGLQRPKTDADKISAAQDKFGVFVSAWSKSVSDLSAVMDKFNAAVEKFNAKQIAGASSGTGGASSSAVASAAAGAAAGAKAGVSTALVANTKNNGMVAATNDINAGVSIANVAKLGVGKGVGALTSVAGALTDAAKVSKFAQLSSVMSSVMPVIGIIGAVAGLASMFGGSGKKTPTDFKQEGFKTLLTNFGSMIDSGYSGPSGIRSLMHQSSMQQAGVHGLTQPANINIVFHEGAVQAHGVQDPLAFAKLAAPAVAEHIARQANFENSRRGGG